MTLYSWVSINYSKTGTLAANNVTIDFRDNSYAGYYDEAYGYGWCPGIFNSSSNVKVNNTDMTILVDSNIDLNGQIFNGKLQSGTTVVLDNDIAIDSMLQMNTDNVVLDLNGNTITASDKFKSTFDNDAHLINTSGKNVTVENGRLVATDKNKHVVNVYGAKNTTLENLTLDHTNAAK